MRARMPAWSLDLAVYVVAVLARLPLAKGNPYTAEGAHFAVANRLWSTASNIELVYPVWPFGFPQAACDECTAPYFWQRPLFALFLHPATQGSFEGFRVGHLLLTSLLAVLCARILRDRGTPAWIAYGAAVGVAVSPSFVVWGAVAMPDSLMTVLLAAAVWLWGRGKRLGAAGAGLAAAWTKEVGIVVLVALVAWQARPALIDWWSARRMASIPRSTAYYLAALGLAPLPLVFSLSAGATFPGWGRGGDVGSALDWVFLVPWLAPLVAVGLRWPRTRPLSVVSLAFSGFFLAYRVFFGRTIEVWYFVGPQFFALVAAVLAADEWRRRARASGSRSIRAVPVAVLVLLGAALVAQATSGADSPGKAALFTPFSGRSGQSLTEAYGWWAAYDHDLTTILGAMQGSDWDAVFLADTDWSYPMYPFSFRARSVLYAFSPLATYYHQETGPWAEAIEAGSHATILYKLDSPLNLATREVYQDCVALDNPSYQLIRGTGCSGRAAQLDAAYQRLLGPAPR